MPELEPIPPRPEDLIDVEAPPQGGDRVDTPAYAGAPEPGRAPAASAADGIDVEAPPPPPPRGEGGDDPYAGEDMQAPPRAGPELGGGPAAVSAPPADADPVDAAVDALLDLARDRPWGEITLRDVAGRAGVSFASVYARASSKAALVARLSDRYDRAALREVEGDRQPEPRDRLFEAFMARLEAMGAHRDVLIAIGRAEPLLVASRLGRTARALAEASGVDTSGGRGALRLAALVPAWARTLQVWRDDEGALNRTMAEIDKLLRRADGRLARVGAGF